MRKARRTWARSAALAALASCVATAAQAQLVGGRVTGGSASITETAQSALIQQTSPRAIITWTGFSIPKGYSVTVEQPGASSVLLNRVTGGTPSYLLGALSANGQVWIVNPAGIITGSGAQITAAGLLLSTAGISDANFFAGNAVFDEPGNPGAQVFNGGTITVSDGYAVLAGAQVANGGVIEARLGSVVLAGATTYAVDFSGDHLLSFAVATGSSAAGTLVRNAGTIAADGGTVLLTAQAAKAVLDNVINTSGIIEADSVSTQNGKIVLMASNGGTEVSGALDASGKAAGETGGEVDVLGNSVTLDAGATVDVSGSAGGGTALVGGNFHGAGPEPDALTTTVAAGAQIIASALDQGNGGNVAVWSNGSTVFNGSITADGGAAGGDGGRIETSGATLSVGTTASVMALAPNGAVGNWLLDPTNINVVTGGTATLANVDTLPNNVTIDPTTIDVAGANVTLDASNNITVTNSIGMTTAGVGITMAASNSIILDAGITTIGGAVSLSASLGIVTGPSAAAFINSSGGAGAPNGGAITITANDGITIGGAVVANGGFNGTTGGNGGTVSINAGAGAISIGANLTPSVLGSGDFQEYSQLSVVAKGATATSSTELPGTGGAVALTAGTNVTLPYGITVSGGDVTDAAIGSTAAGAAGGSISITASGGSVSAGGAATGTLAQLFANGGNSVGGAGGAGGSVFVSAGTVTLAGASTSGGSTLATAPSGGNAGNITIVASATSGAAVTLYGESDAADSDALVANYTLRATGGGSEVVVVSETPYRVAPIEGVGGVSTPQNGHGGDIVIEGSTTGASLGGTAYIQLATGTAPTLNGGSRVAIAVTGGANPGTALLEGSVEATTAGVESLNLLGHATISGSVGDVVALNTLSIVNGGIVQIAGTTTVDTEIAAFANNAPTGAITTNFSFGGTVTTPLFTSASTSGAEPLTLDISLALTLAGATTFDTSSDDANIIFASTLNVTNHGALTITAGTGNVTFDGEVGGVSAPGNIEVSAGVITIGTIGGFTVVGAGGSDTELVANTNLLIDTPISASNGAGTLVLYADNSAGDSGTVSFGGSGSVSWGSGPVQIYYYPGADSYTNSTPSQFVTNISSSGSVQAFQTVDSATDLQNIDNALAGLYAINGNINLSSIANFSPIGTISGPFTGELIGDENSFNNPKFFVLSGLTINSALGDVGLFGVLGSTAIVRGFGLNDFSVTGSASSASIGALAGLAEPGSSIVHFQVFDGTVVGSAVNETIGGLVGTAEGNVAGFPSTTTSGIGVVSSAADVVADNTGASVGGLVGALVNGGIVSAFATGNVSAPNASNVGGLVGEMVYISSINSLQPVLSETYATGTVLAGASSNVGGLVGSMMAGTIEQSYAESPTIAGTNSSIGGLVGEMDGGSNATTPGLSAVVEDSYAMGPVSGGTSNKAGALVGIIGDLAGIGSQTITVSYGSGAVAAGSSSDLGGVVGLISSTATTTIGSDVHWDKTTTGQAHADSASDTVDHATGLTTVQFATVGQEATNYGASWVFSGGSAVWYLAPGMAHPILFSENNGFRASGHELELMGAPSGSPDGSGIDSSFGLDQSVDMTAEMNNPGGAWFVASNASTNPSSAGAYGFVPIGSSGSPFAGTFDGGGNSITGLTIVTTSGSVNAGLFDTITGTVQNVTLVGVNVSTTASSEIGALAGANLGGTIANVIVQSGQVSSTAGGVLDVGGLVGYDSGTVSGSSSNVAVSWANGAAATNSAIVGGLVGDMNQLGEVSASTSGGEVSVTLTASVSGPNVMVGGLVGSSAGTIIDSNSGGEVGAVLAGTSANSFAYVGGLVGYDTGPISNSNTGGDVSAVNETTAGLGELDVGGLVGILVPNATASLPTPTISNSAAFGGSVSGILEAASGNTYVGGLVGQETSNSNYSTVIKDSYASDPVIATGGAIVGGLVGFSTTGGSPTFIENSYSDGTIVTGGAGATIGGLVGQDDGATLEAVYSTSTVLGATGVTIGGLVGSNAASGTISQAWSSGTVNFASGTGGGFVGSNGGTITAGFWDSTASGLATGVGSGSSSGVTALTSSTAYLAASYADFDFAGTWYLISGDTRPFLQSEYSTSIANVHQLQLMDMNLSATYTIANDSSTDASETASASGMWNPANGFVPVGSMTNPFDGTLNGGEFDGVTITSSAQFVGLFGVVSGIGTVEQFDLYNPSVNDPAVSNSHAGALVGLNEGTLYDDLMFQGAVTASSTSAGGLTGENVGTITAGFAVDVTVTGTYAGGLVQEQDGTGTISAAPAESGIIQYSHADSIVIGTAGGFAGGLVGTNSGTIIQSVTEGTVTGGAGSVIGGFVGYNQGTISNSYSIASVTGATGSTSGGFVGQNDGGAISFAYSSGSVTANGSTLVGGFAGTNNASFTDVYWDSTTTGQASGVGSGVSGANPVDTAGSAFASGSYSGWNFAGVWYLIPGETRPILRSEIYAGNDPIQIFDAHALQLVDLNLSGNYVIEVPLDMSGTSNPSDVWNTANGFVPIGSASSTAFTGTFNGQSNAISNLTIASSAGGVGLFGTIGINGTVENVALIDASVTGPTGASVGALAGINLGTVSQSYVTGSTVTGGNNGFTGGLVGFNETSGTIADSYSAVDVSTGGDVGGLAGLNEGSIAQSVAETGIVSTAGANSYVGGLVGVNTGAISESIASSSVSDTGGGSVAGGFVGNNTGAITQSYSSGAVSDASGTLGGFVGTNAGTVLVSYFDSTIAAIGAAGSNSGTLGATGLTTTQMASQSSYVASWDFTNTWYLISGLAHPILRSELPVYQGNTPTTILTTDQLELIGQNAFTEGAQYQIGADIDMAELASVSGPWLTSGNSTIDGGNYGFVPIADFTGYLSGKFRDGTSAEISGLSINAATLANVGLFAEIGIGGDVDHVSLIAPSVSSTLTSGTVGALAGENFGLVGLVSVTDNGTSTASLSGNVTTGGLVGDNFGAIYDAMVGAATIAANNNKPGGAIAGTNSATGLIYRSEASDNDGLVTSVTVGFSEGGALVGLNMGEVVQSQANATVGSISNADVGGLIGENATGGLVFQDLAAGVASSHTSSDLGGLVGVNSGTIAQSAAATDLQVVGGVAFGGLVASSVGGTVTSSYWDENASGVTISPGGGTGLTTAQAQGSFTDLTGFSQTVFGIVSSPAPSYPYFLWKFPTPPSIISGTVYSDRGVTPAGGGILIESLINDESGPTVPTGADGAYYMIGANVPASNVQILTYVAAGQAITGDSFADNAAQSVGGLDIYAGYLRISSAGTTVTGISSDLQTAIGGLSSPDGTVSLSGQLSVSGSLEIDSTATSFTIDEPISASSGTIVLNGVGVSPESWTQVGGITATGLLLLGSGDSFDLNASVADIAGNVGTGTISLGDSVTLDITSVGGTNGVTAASLSVSDDNALIQDQPITVGTFSVSGLTPDNGAFTLTNTANVIGTLSDSGGSVFLLSLRDSRNLAIAATGFTAADMLALYEGSTNTVTVSTGALFAPSLTLSGNFAFTAAAGFDFTAPITIAGTTVLNSSSDNGAIVVGSITGTPNAVLTLNSGTGTTTLTGNVKTMAAVTLSGPTTLGASITIDTTDGDTVPAGGSITFANTLNAATAYVDTLSLTAGTAGNIVFAGQVGHDSTDSTGTTLGAVTIGSADTVSMTMSTGGFNAGALSVSDVASLSEPVGYINTHGSNNSNAQISGGAVSIVASGAVTVAGIIDTVGGFSTSGQGGSSGSVTISAGGAVSVGSGEIGSGNASILTQGYDVASAGQTASNGASVSLSGTSITIGTLIDTRGGSATATGSTSSAGSGGSVNLVATAGNIIIGSAGTNSEGGPSSIVTVGESTIAGFGGNGGSVTLAATGGSVETDATIAAQGGAGSAGFTGSNGGNVSITSNGNVVIGNANHTVMVLQTKYDGNELRDQSASIVTVGASTNYSTSSPGNAGSVTITAANITLPFGVAANGGAAADFLSSALGPVGWAPTAISGYAGASTANGGTAGSITLTATGNVSIGGPGTSLNSGSILGLFAGGGESTGGAGGNGGAISVSGQNVSLARAFASGGDTLSAVSAGGSGGSVTLTGTSGTGGITLWGDSDPAATSTAFLTSTVTARGGFDSLSAFGDIASPAVIVGQGGNVSISVPTGGTIQLDTSPATSATTTAFSGTLSSGSTVVTSIGGSLSTSSLYVGEWISGTGIPADTAIAAINSATSITITNAATTSGATGTLSGLLNPNGNDGGSTVELSVSGGTVGGGTLTVHGPINATTAGVESLRINTFDGNATFANTIGATIALSDLTMGVGSAAAPPPVGGTGGNVTFDAAVTLDGAMTEFNTSGTLDFDALLSTGGFFTNNSAVNIAMIGGANISGNLLLGSGQLTLAGTFDLTGGSGFDDTAAVFLNGATTIDNLGNQITIGQVIVEASSAGLTLNSGTGNTVLSGNIMTMGGAVAIGGPAILDNSVTIDTTNAGGVAAGASVTFGSTLDASSVFSDNLTIKAGSAGNVTFGGRVGHDNNLNVGTTLGAVTIDSASTVSLGMSDGFSAESFTVAGPVGTAGVTSGAASFVDPNGYISTQGATNSAGTLHSSGGAVEIVTSGAITIGGEVNASGGLNPSTSIGGSAGAVTIKSVGGAVSIGGAETLSTSGSGTSLITNDASIAASGFDATTAGQTTGNGGSVTVTGLSISLPLGVIAHGGEGEVAGPNGGNAGSVSLTATAGAVTIGAGADGNAVLVDVAGGNSVSGNVGAGGDVTISGSQITIGAKILADAGGSGAASGTAANAGSVDLVAMASSGAAVVLFGEADLPTAATTNFVTITTVGSRYGATEIDPYDFSGGTITSSTSGNITIASTPGGAPLNGSSFVQLETSTNAALNGGSTIELSAANGTTGTATVMIEGSVEATTANVESLRLRGRIDFPDSVGDIVALNTLALNNANSNTNTTFGSTIGAATAVTVLANSGQVIFDGPVSAGSFSMASGSTSLTMLGGGEFGGTFTTSGGPVTLAGNFNFSSSTDALFLGPITLAGNTSFFGSSSTNIFVDGVTGPYAFVVDPPAGFVSDGAIDVVSLSITATDLAIDGSVTTTGSQGYSGSVTSLGGSQYETNGGSFTASGASYLDVSSVTIDTTGSGAPGGGVSLGSVDNGLAAGASNLVITAGSAGVSIGSIGTNAPLGSISVTAASLSPIFTPDLNVLTTSTFDSATIVTVAPPPPTSTLAGSGSSSLGSSATSTILSTNPVTNNTNTSNSTSTSSTFTTLFSSASTTTPTVTAASFTIGGGAFTVGGGSSSGTGTSSISNVSDLDSGSTDFSTISGTGGGTSAGGTTSGTGANAGGTSSSGGTSSGGTPPSGAAGTSAGATGGTGSVGGGTGGNSGGGQQAASDPFTTVAPIQPVNHSQPIPPSGEAPVGGVGSAIFQWHPVLPIPSGVPGISRPAPSGGNPSLWFVAGAG